MKSEKASLTLEREELRIKEMVERADDLDKSSYTYDCTFKLSPAERQDIENGILALEARLGPSSQMLLVPREKVVEGERLNDGLVSFLMTNQLSDVTFIVNGTKIPSHKALNTSAECFLPGKRSSVNPMTALRFISACS